MVRYAAIYPPNIAVDVRVKEFISSFYAVSDDPGKNEEWVGFFTPDATVIIGDKRASGGDVKSRKHELGKVFPAMFETAHDNTDNKPWRRVEYMLRGTVDYVMKEGERVRMQWAGYAKVVECEDKAGLKMEYYDVHIRR
ncbi:hypothetical protein F4808DRAFT_459217 [Astrocystis sublimbata]|nr:hypothetical protein F4808DRAFT_459217 [Astrocystis sublimbata]